MSDGKTKKPAAKRKPKKIDVRVTHLEMHAKSNRHIPLPTRPTIALMRANAMPAHFYNYLYEMVGKAYHWEKRRCVPDIDLYDMINDEDCEIHVLYADGCPAGFFELSLEAFPKAIELVYFGLGPDFQGLGLGKWFASAAIGAAWEHAPEKLKVQTSTLDHPAALPLYQKLGFMPVAVSEEKITPWV